MSISSLITTQHKNEASPTDADKEKSEKKDETEKSVDKPASITNWHAMPIVKSDD
jgi:hypothetical protein